MSAAIDDLVRQFETRRLTRRELVASLTAIVAGAAAAVSAQTARSSAEALALG